ncbi:hypothetical protein M0R45_026484 [Rubus argutus]|uniref:RRM domain-containing protein n=1 Tax=Rubus argutus TaxID=59490 RepID=A0AAW1WYA2_RUBAR
MDDKKLRYYSRGKEKLQMPSTCKPRKTRASSSLLLDSAQTFKLMRPSTTSTELSLILVGSLVSSLIKLGIWRFLVHGVAILRRKKQLSKPQPAFKGSSYKKLYKDNALYLEWAPDNVLCPSLTTESNGKNSAAVGKHDVKRVMWKEYPGWMILILIELRTVLDVHQLSVHLCHVKQDELQKKDEKGSKKIIVKNVAFEATKRNLRQPLSTYGEIKSLRFPNRLGKYRGFAFVEFVAEQEAEKTIQELASTHLYGRHIVLERAKEDESLEGLRARIAAQLTDDQSVISMKRRQNEMSED